MCGLDFELLGPHLDPTTTYIDLRSMPDRLSIDPCSTQIAPQIAGALLCAMKSPVTFPQNTGNSAETPVRDVPPACMPACAGRQNRPCLAPSSPMMSEIGPIKTGVGREHHPESGPHWRFLRYIGRL